MSAIVTATKPRFIHIKGVWLSVAKTKAIKNLFLKIHGLTRHYDAMALFGFLTDQEIQKRLIKILNLYLHKFRKNKPVYYALCFFQDYLQRLEQEVTDFAYRIVQNRHLREGLFNLRCAVSYQTGYLWGEQS